MRIAGWHNQGWIPEEIAANYQHISLAQVHAALAYYHLNKEEIDADIEAEERFYEASMQRSFVKEPVSQIRLYLDGDAFARRLVNTLRSRGIDVLTALDAGMINRDDEEHLEFATAHGRALYSFNSSDYCKLHAEWVSARRSHAGIVIGRQQPFEVRRQLTSFLYLGCVQIG